MENPVLVWTPWDYNPEDWIGNVGRYKYYICKRESDYEVNVMGVINGYGGWEPLDYVGTLEDAQKKAQDHLNAFHDGPMWKE